MNTPKPCPDALVRIIDELRWRYGYELRTGLGQFPHPNRIRQIDIERWCGELSTDLKGAFDAVGMALAVGFDEHRFNFAFCDAGVNDLRDTQDQMTFWFSGLFWDVYLCFDDGEYHRADDKSDNPTEDFTRPAIRELIARAQPVS